MDRVETQQLVEHIRLTRARPLRLLQRSFVMWLPECKKTVKLEDCAGLAPADPRAASGEIGAAGSTYFEGRVKCTVSEQDPIEFEQQMPTRGAGHQEALRCLERQGVGAAVVPHRHGRVPLPEARSSQLRRTLLLREMGGERRCP